MEDEESGSLQHFAHEICHSRYYLPVKHTFWKLITHLAEMLLICTTSYVFVQKLEQEGQDGPVMLT